MKCLLLLFIFFNAFSFEYNDRSLAYKESAMKLRRHLEIKGLKRFYQNEYRDFELVDQVFEGQGFQILVKTGLLFGNSQNKRLVKFENGYLYHELVGNIPVSIFFKNLEVKEIEKYKSRITSFYKNEKFTLLDIVFPRAYGNCHENYLQSDIGNIKDIENVANEVYDSYLMENIGRCMSAALEGVWQATGGLVQDVGNGFIDFVKSPIKSSKRFWDSAVNTYENTKLFISDFKRNIGELKDTLSQMPAEAQVTFLCNIVASLGTTVLIGVLTTGPGGIAKALASLSQKVLAFKKLSNGLKLISNLKIPKEQINNMISKIVNSKNDKSLEQFEEMATLNMKNLSMDIVQCAL